MPSQSSFSRWTAVALAILLVGGTGGFVCADDREDLIASWKKGEALNAQGKYREAAPYFERALALAPSVFGPEHENTAAMLGNLGLLYHAMGEYAKAEPLFHRGLAIYEAKLGKDDTHVAEALNNLANLYNSSGEYAKAEPLYHRSLKILEAKLGRDDLLVADSLNNLAVVYRSMGQYAKAEPLYRRSLEIREAKLGKDDPKVADSLNNLASLYDHMEQYAKAEPLHKRSLEIREAKLGKDHPNVAFSLNNLAALYRSLDQPAKAEPLCKRSLEILEAKLGKDHPHVANALTNLAHLYGDMEQYAKAEPLFRRSLVINEAKLGKDSPRVADSLYNLALLHVATGRWEEAAKEMDRSRRIARRHAHRTLPLLAEKEQLDFLRNVSERMSHGTFSLALARRGDAGMPELSAGWVLNGKGLAHESLALRAARRSDDSIADPWVSVDRVRAPIPKDATLVEFARFRVLNFGAKKNADTWGPARYAAWVIPPAGKGNVRIIDIGEAEKIDAAVAACRKAIRDAPARIRADGEVEAEKGLRKPLEALAALVLQPLEEHIGRSERWLISPDAALWLAPWSALPLKDGSYAIEKHPIQLLVSGRDLVRPDTREKASRPIVLADPEFDLTPDAARPLLEDLLGGLLPKGTVNSRNFPLDLPAVSRLPGTAAEAASIKPKLTTYAGEDAWVYKGKNALEAVAKTVERPRILVFSTHGFFLEDQVVARSDRPGVDTRAVALTTDGKPLENPLRRCGLLLAGCNQGSKARGKDEDGVLTGEEIVTMDLHGTELVVLSACETGLGKVNNGEGVAGLRQAFQLAGARTVVASLWQVPDRDTALLMIDFFTDLAKKQTKAEALRNAQLARIKARRDRGGAAHPYFWAAFTVTGQ